MVTTQRFTAGIEQQPCFKEVITMYCRHCGNTLGDAAVICVQCGAPKGEGCGFCPNCGAKTTQPAAVYCLSCGGPLTKTKPDTTDGTQTTAIVSLVTGILSILCCSVFVGLPCGIAAIICARKARQKTGAYGPMELAGLICGIVGTALSALCLAATIIYYIAFGVFIFSQAAAESSEYLRILTAWPV